MNDFKLTTTPAMPLNMLIASLSNAYCSVIQRKLPIRILPPVMLWGPSGIGKTQVIRQLADEIQGQTGKRCVITDVRSLLVKLVKSDNLPMDNGEETVNILVLDKSSYTTQSKWNGW